MSSPVVPGPMVIVNTDGSWTLPALLRFMNPLDVVNTGVGSITILPANADEVQAMLNSSIPISEAIAQFVPMIGQGPQGFTPNISQTVNLIELAPGASPPSGTPTASFAEISSGDEETPPTWQLTMYVHRGNDGEFVAPLLQDLGNVVGNLVNDATVLFDTVTGQWNVAPQHLTQFAACTAFTNAPGTSPNAVLGSLTLPAASYARQPVPSATCIVNPAPDGSTTIKLYARLNDPNTGPIIGEALGVPGLTSPYVANLFANAAANDPDNQIASGASGTIYLIAQLVTGNTTAWGTNMADAAFTALGVPA